MISTVKKNGTLSLSNKNNCSTIAARNSLKEDPIVRESKKKKDPVLYAEAKNNYHMLTVNAVLGNWIR